MGLSAFQQGTQASVRSDLGATWKPVGVITRLVQVVALDNLSAHKAARVPDLRCLISVSLWGACVRMVEQLAVHFLDLVGNGAYHEQARTRMPCFAHACTTSGVE